MIVITKEKIKCIICGREPHYCEECHHNSFHNAHISLLQGYMRHEDPLKEIKRILYGKPDPILPVEYVMDEKGKTLYRTGEQKESTDEEHWKVDLKEVFEGLVGVKIPYNIIIKIDSFRDKYNLKRVDKK